MSHVTQQSRSLAAYAGCSVATAAARLDCFLCDPSAAAGLSVHTLHITSTYMCTPAAAQQQYSSSSVPSHPDLHRLVWMCVTACRCCCQTCACPLGLCSSTCSDAFADEDLLVEFGAVSNPKQAADLQARLEERRAAAAAATTSSSGAAATATSSSSSRATQKKGAFVPRKLRKSQLPIEALPKVAIVGRPNVGKSALFNRLAGSSLAVVYDYPGVTRDRLYTRAFWGDKEYCLIDTGACLWGQEGGVAICCAADAVGGSDILSQQQQRQHQHRCFCRAHAQ